ncbi:MAG: serine protease [Patescibacteria group bacterium]|nr:serine protease [Patescibacteria group bacterium]
MANDWRYTRDTEEMAAEIRADVWRRRRHIAFALCLLLAALGSLIYLQFVDAHSGSPDDYLNQAMPARGRSHPFVQLVIKPGVPTGLPPAVQKVSQQTTIMCITADKWRQGESSSRIGEFFTSGVVLKDGLVLTVAHGLSDFRKPVGTDLMVNCGGRRVFASVKAMDEVADLALLSADCRGATLRVARETPPEAKVFVVGFEMDTEAPELTAIRFGRITAIDRTVQVIQPGEKKEQFDREFYVRLEALMKSKQPLPVALYGDSKPVSAQSGSPVSLEDGTLVAILRTSRPDQGKLGHSYVVQAELVQKLLANADVSLD